MKAVALVIAGLRAALVTQRFYLSPIKLGGCQLFCPVVNALKNGLGLILLDPCSFGYRPGYGFSVLRHYDLLATLDSVQ